MIIIFEGRPPAPRGGLDIGEQLGGHLAPGIATEIPVRDLVCPPAGHVHPVGLGLGPILVPGREPNDARPRGLSTWRRPSSPAWSLSGETYHGVAIKNRPAIAVVNSAVALPSVTTAARSPRASPTAKASSSPSTTTSSRPAGPSRGPRVADEAGRIAEGFQVLRGAPPGLGTSPRPPVVRAELDHRQPLPDEPGDDHPGRFPRHPVRPGRPPEAGGADRLGGQATFGAGQVGQGVRPLGRPESGGGVFHEGQGVRLGHPRRFGRRFGRGARGDSPRASWPRGGRSAGQVGEGLGERHRLDAHHEGRGVPRLATPVTIPPRVAQLDAEGRVSDPGESRSGHGRKARAFGRPGDLGRRPAGRSPRPPGRSRRARPSNRSRLAGGRDGSSGSSRMNPFLEANRPNEARPAEGPTVLLASSTDGKFAATGAGDRRVNDRLARRPSSGEAGQEVRNPGRGTS